MNAALRAGFGLGALGLVLLAASEPRLGRVRAASVWPVVADGGADWVGVLMQGAVVELAGCADGGPASLEGGRALAGCGAFEATDAGAPAANGPPLIWGAVRDRGVKVRARARVDAPTLEVVAPPYTLALIDDAALAGLGWAKRPGGGFVRLSEVRLARPSAFEGEPRPRLPLAFALRDTAVAPRPPLLGPAAPVRRHARFEVEAVEGGAVLIADGVLPRAAVRLAWRRPRPAAVPEGASWVHVDLSEQVLVAYESDQPVYATLISAGIGGAPERRTRTGLFEVWLKSLHDRMHGEGYFVEEVPFIMYFSRGQAVHGAFWHDAFGRPASHGCINLSPADARWLFEWAPPRLPAGWHTVRPAPLGVASLWVQLEHARAPTPSAPLAPLAQDEAR